MSLDAFHPAVSGWFRDTFRAPTAPQLEGWPSIQARQHTLIAAPTGSGKTLAAFLCAIDALVREGLEAPLLDETHVLYISPLRALSNDIEKNLRQPIQGIRKQLADMGLPDVDMRTAVRTGDTTRSQRGKAIRRPPHLFVTTPESLYILLTSESGRRMLATVRTIIIDEIHALLGDKRGSHLALSMERLQALVGPDLVRVGLSATQKPIETVARFLVGGSAPTGSSLPESEASGERAAESRCRIVDGGHARTLDLAIEVPSSPLETVMSAEVWSEVYDRLAALVSGHRTTLIFVNTRRLAERAAMNLGLRLGAENVAAHHGSLAKEARFDAEQRLKNGQVQALVATASLELGIDIGDVDLVCQIGSTRSIAAFLQRVGRSGHQLSAIPKGRIFPLSRDELVESAALLLSVRRGDLDAIIMPEAPLDILAQQIVAEVAAAEWGEDELYRLVCRAYPFRDLTRDRFDEVIRMLAEGFTTRRGRRGAHIHHDVVNGVIRGRRGARIAAMTSGGAIPEKADYDVILDPTDTNVGTLNEDFAIESMPGDIFQLGTHAWQIQRVESGQVRVIDAQGKPPTVPFWLGEAPSRTPELSAAVSAIREGVVERVVFGDEYESGADTSAAAEWLAREAGVNAGAGQQLADYLAACAAPFGVVPSQRTLVLERFFDETESMHLVLHAPFGSRVNRAWGLALRKRFCRNFNFELQAAANEDAILLSLGPTHSFELESIFRYLDHRTVRGVLVQALLDAPMFPTRWRWNASRALAVLRFRSGKKVPPRFQRMDADDLVAVCFPDQLACLENIQGPREVPDHPLITQTIHDCLTEAMDIEGLEGVLEKVVNGEIRMVSRDLREPSPLAHEILNAKPYAFLDEAPLEERRTMAVQSRRWLDARTASELAFLEPAAIDRVRDEAWPNPRTPDELHDALVTCGAFRESEAQAHAGWGSLFDTLLSDGRAFRLALPDATLWVAAERAAELALVYPDAARRPDHPLPARLLRCDRDRDTAVVELVRGRLEVAGPVTERALAQALAISAPDTTTALATLQNEGFVFKGRYSKGAEEDEWCQRRLLARIHRYTLRTLRDAIRPVSKADFVRYLLSWQRVSAPAEGIEGLAAVLEQLEGYEVAAGAWEAEVLPLRVDGYEPGWLDGLCLAGRVTWARLRPPASEASEAAPAPSPIRSSPISILSRQAVAAWQTALHLELPDPVLSKNALAVQAQLQANGAQFFDALAETLAWSDATLSEALGELVGVGRVAADSFAGMRALLLPAGRRAKPPRGRRRSGVTPMHGAGRWSLLDSPASAPASTTQEPVLSGAPGPEVERAAHALLRRYGVVFRSLLEREGSLPPWRVLLRTFRRMEDRGEVRGGRFVSGFTGEQFALPGAIATLRSARKQPKDGASLIVSGVDPLNLVGIVLPGDRVPSLPANRILYRDGEAIAALVGGEVRLLTRLDDEQAWAANMALRRGVAADGAGLGRCTSARRGSAPIDNSARRRLRASPYPPERRH